MPAHLLIHTGRVSIERKLTLSRFKQRFQIISPRLIAILALIENLHAESTIAEVCREFLPGHFMSKFAEVISY